MSAFEWPVPWQARWIWAERPVATPASVFAIGPLPRATWNRFRYLRRAFALETIPKTVPARVMADSRFVLFVNGVEVARGPARAMPECPAYTELDLAACLRVGRNAIAVLVRFYGKPTPWWRPAALLGELGYGSFAFEAPAIGIASDGSWSGRAAPYRQDAPGSSGQPPLEILDGAGVPAGWTAANHDDAAWPPCVELRNGPLASPSGLIPLAPFASPEPSAIAPLTALPVALVELGRQGIAAISADDPLAADAEQLRRGGGSGPDRYLTFDAGRITLATPWLQLRGEAGAVVDCYLGEDLRADGTVEFRPRCYGLRYILRAGSAERVEGFEAAGFRYLGVALRRQVELQAAGATERRYPRDAAASFASDDERLNRIWSVGARKLDVCSTDAFIDCPGREQRAWVGDSYIHALLTYVTSNDWRLVRRHLRLCAQSRRADGLLSMVASGDASLSPVTIPDYSLHWVRALARYLEYSGDRETVRELLPVALGILHAFERCRAPEGLLRGVAGWVLIDWAQIGRGEVTGALDALYSAALDDCAEVVAAVAHDSGAVAHLRARAQRTRAGFELLWDEARGVYVDAADAERPVRRVSQHTNALAIIGGCAPRERWPRMLDKILDRGRLLLTPSPAEVGYDLSRWYAETLTDFDEERNIVEAQPFFSHFVHQAIALAGRRELIPDLCLRWWPQIERGNTTFEEFWQAKPGTAAAPTLGRARRPTTSRPISSACVRSNRATVARKSGRCSVACSGSRAVYRRRTG
jgi:alpha-L-rhamnosidase